MNNRLALAKKTAGHRTSDNPFFKSMLAFFIDGYMRNSAPMN